MSVYVGTSGYSYKEWKGSFYPEKIAATAMLKFYAERFGTVEINNTFYRMPAASMLEGWCAEVPPGFRFVLKAPQIMTHVKRLKDIAQPLEHFLNVAAVMGERLGPLLFQLPPNFKKDLARLEGFLHALPKGVRVACEFRHASWFDDAVYQALRARDAALCVAESEDLETPLVKTATWGYLRLRERDYEAKDLRVWAERIAAQDFSDAFVFFKHEDEGKGPRFAAALVDVLAARG